MLWYEFTSKWWFNLKVTSHGILHYLWSADLSKSFSQLNVSIFTFPNQQFWLIFIFSQYFFQKILPSKKGWGYPSLLISWLINFKYSVSHYLIILTFLVLQWKILLTFLAKIYCQKHVLPTFLRICSP